MEFTALYASGPQAGSHGTRPSMRWLPVRSSLPKYPPPKNPTAYDGKRPDGLTLILWQGGKPLCWDVTVACPVANSYIQTAIGSAGAVAKMAATRKSTKYGALESQYCFQPIALESLGPTNSDARQFLSDLGRRISRSSGDDKETSFLFQRISVLLFRFNSVLLHDGFVLDDPPEQYSLSSIFYFWIFFLPSFLRGFKK